MKTDFLRMENEKKRSWVSSHNITTATQQKPPQQQQQQQQQQLQQHFQRFGPSLSVSASMGTLGFASASTGNNNKSSSVVIDPSIEALLREIRYVLGNNRLSNNLATKVFSFTTGPAALPSPTPTTILCHLHQQIRPQ